MTTNTVIIILVVCGDDNKLYFPPHFLNLISCVGRKATKRWDLLSRGLTVKPIFHRVFQALWWWAWCIAEHSKVDCYGWKQIVIYDNCGFQDPSQKPSHVNIRDTHSDGCNRTYSIIHTNTHSHCVCFLFPTLSLVLHEWRSYSLHRLDYYSIKPVIVLDSSYLSPVGYGSLELSDNSVREWKNGERVPNLTL